MFAAVQQFAGQPFEVGEVQHPLFLLDALVVCQQVGACPVPGQRIVQGIAACLAIAQFQQGIDALLMQRQEFRFTGCAQAFLLRRGGLAFPRFSVRLEKYRGNGIQQCRGL